MKFSTPVYKYFVLLLLVIASCTKESTGNTSIPFSENGNMAFGNPDKATTDTLNSQHYLMVKQQYCLSYNNSTHTANWVSWHLTLSNLGTTNRQNNFKPDTTLPTHWYAVKNSDYSSTGFDRGHLCPSADRTASITDNTATFLLTNIIPQAPLVNRNPWAKLEEYCRDLVTDGNELYIIAGVFGKGGMGNIGNANALKNQLIVPAYIWKIILVLPLGNTDLKRVTTETRIIAIYMPNTQESAQKKWFEWRVNINSIEKITGFDFFNIIPDNIENVLESKTDLYEF